MRDHDHVALVARDTALSADPRFDVPDGTD
jgi:hypothetical protein